MTRVASDATLASALAEKSRERASFFSWGKAAEQTFHLYMEVLGRRDDDLLQNGAKGSSATLAASHLGQHP
jgi:hypothetical protein